MTFNMLPQNQMFGYPMFSPPPQYGNQSAGLLGMGAGGGAPQLNLGGAGQQQQGAGGGLLGAFSGGGRPGGADYGSGVTPAGMGPAFNGSIGDWLGTVLGGGPIMSLLGLPGASNGTPATIAGYGQMLRGLFDKDYQAKLNMGPPDSGQRNGNDQTGNDIFGGGSGGSSYGQQIIGPDMKVDNNRNGMLAPDSGPVVMPNNTWTIDDTAREMADANSGNDWSGSDYNSGDSGMGGFYNKGGLVNKGLNNANPPGPDNRVIAAQTGEGVLNRTAMQRYGGAKLVRALNSGVVDARALNAILANGAKKRK